MTAKLQPWAIVADEEGRVQGFVELDPERGKLVGGAIQLRVGESLLFGVDGGIATILMAPPAHSPQGARGGLLGRRFLQRELSLGEMQRLLTFLPDDAIRELARGPYPERAVDVTGQCRACEVLTPLTASGPAFALLSWHDLHGVGVDVLSALQERDESVKREIGSEDHEVARVAGELPGALSYARSCMIYASAQAIVEGWSN